MEIKGDFEIKVVKGTETCKMIITVTIYQGILNVATSHNEHSCGILSDMV